MRSSETSSLNSWILSSRCSLPAAISAGEVGFDAQYPSIRSPWLQSHSVRGEEETVCRYLLFWAETHSMVQSLTRSCARLIPLFCISSDQKTTFKSNIFMFFSARNRRKLISLHLLQDFNARVHARAHTHTQEKGVT